MKRRVTYCLCGFRAASVAIAFLGTATAASAYFGAAVRITASFWAAFIVIFELANNTHVRS
jgi:hypothetical protein